MKAKIIEKEKEKKFEPIVVELTIESEEELCDLWHRLNISPSTIEAFDNYNIGQLKYGVYGKSNSFWLAINKFVAEKNLSK